MSDLVKKQSILILSVIIIGITFSLVPSISQPLEFHQFADETPLLMIPNWLNVVSNLPLLIVGVIGLLWRNNIVMHDDLRRFYNSLCVGTILTALGSTFFHWEPNMFTLMFDRLPMTLVFMSLFSIILAEQVSLKLAKSLFIPLILVGLFSVVYWYFTEINGRGDLRLYLLVQFLPMLLMPIILVSFRSPNKTTLGYWQVLMCYALAKLLEFFDGEIFEFSAIISGHSLKHLLAAVALYLLFRFYRQRDM